jgi:hypothetical protein
MQVYKGNGDVVKMVNQKDGSHLSANRNEWVLKDDALRMKIALELMVSVFQSISEGYVEDGAIILAQNALID